MMVVDFWALRLVAFGTYPDSRGKNEVMSNSPYKNKRVWLLGAGFSRHLGAPLFNELFSPQLATLVKTTYPMSAAPSRLYDSFDRIGGIYQGGVLGSDAQSRVLSDAWRDPEHFLEIISGWAADPSTVFAEFKNLHSTRDWSKLLVSALRRLAAEVTYCYDNENVLKGERGIAYRQWASGLKAGTDVIITFNYDTIVEKVVKNNLEVLRGLPCRSKEAEFDHRIPLLKMHGSVDWKSTPNGIEACEIDDTLNALRSPEEFAMAIPGAGKLGFSNNNSWLWNCAEQFIQHASVINFVGYRIPETDGLALNSISKSIRRRCESCKPSERPNVNVVLGPIATPDRKRVEGLLRALLFNPRARTLDLPGFQVQDMWAQDFFQLSGSLTGGRQ